MVKALHWAASSCMPVLYLIMLIIILIQTSALNEAPPPAIEAQPLVTVLPNIETSFPPDLPPDLLAVYQSNPPPHDTMQPPTGPPSGPPPPKIGTVNTQCLHFSQAQQQEIMILPFLFSIPLRNLDKLTPASTRPGHISLVSRAAIQCTHVATAQARHCHNRVSTNPREL